MACDDNELYTIKQHPLSFDGLVPFFLPRCELNVGKLTKRLALGKLSREILAEHSGQVLCGEDLDVQGPKVDGLEKLPDAEKDIVLHGLDEETLQATVAKARSVWRLKQMRML